MSEKKIATIYDFTRFCKAKICNECELHFYNCTLNSPGKEKDIDLINETVIKWCEEHPIKTRQSEFLKLYPKASIMDIGVLEICPQEIERGSVDCGLYSSKNCYDCKKDYWLQEVE